jgi:hypothetical protein
MRVDVRPINICGRPLPKSQRTKQPASQGKLRIGENRLHELGRVVLCATLTDTSDGLETPLLPELMDVQVIWVEDSSMRLRGTEKVEGVHYAQTWDITVL